MSQQKYIHLQANSALSVFMRKVRVAFTPPGVTLTAKMNGGYVIRGKNKAGWGGRGVYIYREDIEPELQMIPKLLPRGGTFIDIGANVGVYSMLAASIVGVAGKVISIEPFPEIYAQLYRNVAANRFGDIVRTRNLCISGATGPTILWMNYDRPHSFSLNREGLSGGLSVLSVRLDDLVKWEGLEEIDYIKIDAEGAEMAILDGSEYVLARFRPIVQIEDVDRIIYQRLKRYRAFSVPGTRNSLLIPDERFAKIGNVFTMPWQQLD